MLCSLLLYYICTYVLYYILHIDVDVFESLTSVLECSAVHFSYTGHTGMDGSPL